MDRIDVLAFLTFCVAAGTCAGIAYIYAGIGGISGIAFAVAWSCVAALSANFGRLVYRKSTEAANR